MRLSTAVIFSVLAVANAAPVYVSSGSGQAPSDKSTGFAEIPTRVTDKVFTNGGGPLKRRQFGALSKMVPGGLLGSNSGSSKRHLDHEEGSLLKRHGEKKDKEETVVKNNHNEYVNKDNNNQQSDTTDDSVDSGSNKRESTGKSAVNVNIKREESVIKDNHNEYVNKDNNNQSSGTTDNSVDSGSNKRESTGKSNVNVNIKREESVRAAPVKRHGEKKDKEETVVKNNHNEYVNKDNNNQSSSTTDDSVDSGSNKRESTGRSAVNVNIKRQASTGAFSATTGAVGGAIGGVATGETIGSTDGTVGETTETFGMKRSVIKAKRDGILNRVVSPPSTPSPEGMMKAAQGFVPGSQTKSSGSSGAAPQ